MCIPELIFFDDDSRDRHSRHRGDAIRPLSAESTTAQPLLSSPPFVVHISPKIGHHHHPSTRHQPTRRSTAPLPSREREEMEWREGFRAHRDAVRMREAEERKRSVEEVKNNVVTESQAKAKVPEIVITAATPKKKLESTPAPTAPKPATVETHVTVKQQQEQKQQPSLQRTVSAPQTAPKKPASAPPSPDVLRRPPQPPSQQQQPRKTPHPPPSQQQQDQPYIYTHRQSHLSTRPHSPSHDSSSSRSLRGLKRRLSNIWRHVAGLERWAMDEDTRARQARYNRDRRELEIRRARERQAAADDEARQRRTRRTGEEVWVEHDDRRASRRRRGVAVGAGSAAPRRRMRRVVVIDDERNRNREQASSWSDSRWNWERGL